MRIGLFTDTYFPEINGVANSTYLLKQSLESRGHTVYVFTSTYKEAFEDEESNVIRIHSIDARIAKDRRLALPVITYWKRKLKIFELDLIHTQTEFTMGYLGRKTAEYLEIPHIHTYHTMYEDYTHYLKVPGNKRLKPMVGRFTRWFCNEADEVIVPTDKVRRRLRDYRVASSVSVIPTGLDCNKYKHINHHHVAVLCHELGLEGKQVFIYVGRLAKEKNIDELIRYFSKIPGDKLRFLIVGDGPARRELKQLVRRLGEHRILFTGYVDWVEIQDYYALGDIFLSASTSETQGLTYHEALAGGLRLLVKRDPCLDGVLYEGVNGYGFDGEEEFRANFRKVLKLTKSREELYSSDDFAELVEEVYVKNLHTSEYSLNRP